MNHGHGLNQPHATLSNNEKALNNRNHIHSQSLLVNPGRSAGLPLADALGEPKGDLGIGGLDGVGTVADVAADLDAEVAADGAHGGLGGHGGAEHLASLEDDVLALPDHANDRTGGHVVDEAGEEALRGEVLVVLLHVLPAGTRELHGNQLVALLLEALDDFAGESALDAVGLDHDVGA